MQGHQLSLLLCTLSTEVPSIKRACDGAAQIVSFFRENMQAMKWLRERMTMVYGKTKPLRSFPATRFGYLYLMVRDVFDSLKACELVIMEDRWRNKYKDSPKAEQLRTTLNAPWFRDNLEEAVYLLSPISAELQSIEADRANVALVIPMWRRIFSHLLQYCTKYKRIKGMFLD